MISRLRLSNVRGPEIVLTSPVALLGVAAACSVALLEVSCCAMRPSGSACSAAPLCGSTEAAPGGSRLGVVPWLGGSGMHTVGISCSTSRRRCGMLCSTARGSVMRRDAREQLSGSCGTYMQFLHSPGRWRGAVPEISIQRAAPLPKLCLCIDVAIICDA